MRKYNLLFDGSILTNEFSKNDARSGIFFTTKNMFNELLKREDINLFLYCDLSKLQTLKEYLKKYDLDIEIINECQCNWLYNVKSFSRNQKVACDKIAQPFKRSLWSVVYCFLSVLSNVYEQFDIHVALKKRLEKIDFYFSPCKKVPNIVKNKKNIKSSVYLHDTIPLILPEYFPQVFSGNYWICDLVKSLRKNDVYFANSECTKKDFLKYSDKITENQITVAYLAAAEHFKPSQNSEQQDTAKAKYNIPTDKKYIFSLCTLDPRKNLVRAVKTFVQFIKKDNIDDIVFVLGGGQWESFINKLEQEIDNLGEYKDKIIRAGYIDDEDLPILYSGAEWFVYTSQYEGFGLPPLEAMSCGCPVITSNNSSLPEVVGDAGIMIDWDNDEQHIEAYEKYYYNENLRKEYAQKGLERARQFSWTQCTNIIVERLIHEI